MILSVKVKERKTQFSRKDSQQIENGKDITEVHHSVLLIKAGQFKVNNS